MDSSINICGMTKLQKQHNKTIQNLCPFPHLTLLQYLLLIKNCYSFTQVKLGPSEHNYVHGVYIIAVY